MVVIAMMILSFKSLALIRKLVILVISSFKWFVLIIRKLATEEQFPWKVLFITWRNWFGKFRIWKQIYLFSLYSLLWYSKQQKTIKRFSSLTGWLDEFCLHFFHEQPFVFRRWKTEATLSMTCDTTPWSALTNMLDWLIDWFDWLIVLTNTHHTLISFDDSRWRICEPD